MDNRSSAPTYELGSVEQSKDCCILGQFAGVDYENALTAKRDTERDITAQDIIYLEQRRALAYQCGQSAIGCLLQEYGMTESAPQQENN